MKQSIVLSSLREVDYTTISLPVIAVYDNPKDFPGKFVARVWDMFEPSALCVVKDTLEEIHAAIPQGFHYMAPDVYDDPVIVEVYI